MTIALDWDNTFTADPGLFRALVHLFRGNGHRVIIVTNRGGTWTNEKDITSACPHADGYVFAGNRMKRDAVRAAGYSVDIWIDDTPETIGDAGATLIAPAPAAKIAEYARDRDEAREAADQILYVTFHYYGDEQAGALLDRKVWKRFPWLSENGKDAPCA